MSSIGSYLTYVACTFSYLVHLCNKALYFHHPLESLSCPGVALLAHKILGKLDQRFHLRQAPNGTSLRGGGRGGGGGGCAYV